MADSRNDSNTAEIPVGDKGQFKTTIPLKWPQQLSSDFAGTVRLSRKFNCSAGMSDADEVWLTIASLKVPAEVSLNGTLLSPLASQGKDADRADPQSHIEFAVSKLLTPFNDLVILLKIRGETPDVLLGDVAIEIAQ